MATIKQRGPSQFQAIVRRKGYPSQTRTFETRAAARAWAADVESEMRRDAFIDRSEAERTTLRELLERYLSEVTPTKRSCQAEAKRLKQLLRHPLALRTLASLRSVDFAKFRDERLKAASADTVRLDLALLSAAFNAARKDWSIAVDNPIALLRKPPPSRGRTRRLEGNEETRLLGVADPELRLCIVLAIETGMRQRNLAELTWEQVDLRDQVIYLDRTKNGDAHAVPLSVAAEAMLLALPRPLHGGRVTGFRDGAALGRKFRRACAKTGITNLRFHDLRHEAASRVAPYMPATTLAKVLGWKSITMAMRYYNPTANELVDARRKAESQAADL